MALPNYDDLKTLDKVAFGSPFVETPAKDIDLWTLDYVWRGAPFGRNKYSGVTTTTNSTIFFAMEF
jgi:hypothetical protein